MKKEKFIQFFLNIPISINNLYGDPFFPSQVENTFIKLEKLKKSKHQGIVSIITKTELDEKIVQKLVTFKNRLKLIILVSISNLPYSIEKIKGNRYNTLALCNKYEIPCLAYIRPFIPNENTSREKIEEIFKKISETNTKVAVISGLRGNDNILNNLNINDEEKAKLSLRVKIVPPEVRKLIDEFKVKYNLTIFERTSCGVSYVLGLSHSYNPYYASPQLAKCINCPLKESCFDKQNEFVPTNEDVEFLKLLNYDCSLINNNSFEFCKVNPEKRTECISCCTSCFKLKRNNIQLKKFKDICLGDIGLARLLLQKHVFCDNIIDSGDSTVARPKNPFLKDFNLYILNSWWSYSRNIKSCYQCSYCIVPMFKNESQEYGDLPLDVAKKLIFELEKGGYKFE